MSERVSLSAKMSPSPRMPASIVPSPDASRDGRGDQVLANESSAPTASSSRSAPSHLAPRWRISSCLALQRRCPLDEGLYEGADVRGEELAFGIHDGDVVFGFYDTGQHLHEHTALDQICDQEPRKQRDPQRINGSFAEEAKVIRRERA